MQFLAAGCARPDNRTLVPEPAMEAPFVTTCLRAGLASALIAVASTGHCDDRDALAYGTKAAVLPDIDSPMPIATPVYPERWCILTFIAENRPATVGSHARSALAYASHPSAAQGPWAADEPAYTDSSSLYHRLMSLRSVNLMTLWRGRDSALVVGINSDGLLGISLDEADAPE